jgi:hypothetical protein
LDTAKVLLCFRLYAALIHIRTGASSGGSWLRVDCVAVLLTGQIFADTHGRYSTVVETKVDRLLSLELIRASSVSMRAIVE